MDVSVIKWGVYPWCPEHGSEYIHVEDLDAFKEEAHNCKVFACIGEGEYMTLIYNNRRYRVRAQLFKQVPAPKYNFGQKLRIRKNSEGVTVTDIMWHYNEQKHYYLVAAGNRKKSKWYFEDEVV